MGLEKSSKLVQLQTTLPEGLLATAAWLKKKGYSDQLLKKYRAAGWIESPARGVYRRPGARLRWEQVVSSLGKLLDQPPHVGGLSALELHGRAHYLKPRGPGSIHLYSNEPLPKWVHELPLKERFVEHRDRLFQGATGIAGLVGSEKTGERDHTDALRQSLTAEPYGPWDWDLVYSTPERAILEFLDEVPKRETVDHAERLLGLLGDLSSRRVVKLLAACRSVKVKRLFLALASRRAFHWVKPVLEAADRGEFALGKGKRSLGPGGQLDRKYLITLPPKRDV